jgi:predicted nuclease of restriction endonuclease-like RecB superfamily
LLPEKIIPARIERGSVIPTWLGTHDHAWLGILMEEIDRFRGRPRRELSERLRAPLPCAAPFGKRQAATAVLLRLWRAVEHAPVAPGEAREALFTEAGARPGQSRSIAVAAAAGRLGVTAAELEAALFADLPGERIVRPPDEIPSVQDAALKVNLAIAKSLLFRASAVHVRAEGSVRPVVRQARLRGLLCTVRSGPPPTLEISGPFALFRRTLLYGRALGEVLPFLARTARFELEARCCIGGLEGDLRIRSGDPIFPAAGPKVFDSKLEERFARDFKKHAPDWDLVREPEPVPAGGTLIFPDFLMRHRLHPGREHLIEIVGFWTSDYIQKKLDRLRAAGIRNLILAIDEERRCADGDLPPGARVVWYRRRIDPASILAQAAV